MCKAMNRSFFNVLLGGFSGATAAASTGDQRQRPVKSGSADDAAFLMGNAETVIIVPGRRPFRNSASRRRPNPQVAGG